MLSGGTLLGLTVGTVQEEGSKLQLISHAKLPPEYPKVTQVFPCKFPLSQSSPLSIILLPQTLILTVTVALTELVELAFVSLALNKYNIINAKKNSVR